MARLVPEERRQRHTEIRKCPYFQMGALGVKNKRRSRCVQENAQRGVSQQQKRPGVRLKRPGVGLAESISGMALLRLLDCFVDQHG